MIALAMVACERKDISFRTAVENLRFGGFTEPLHVFAEPGLDIPQDIPNVVAHHNVAQLGGCRNYLQAVEWLLNNTTEPYVMVVENDVEYCICAHERLLFGIRMFPTGAAFNLYLPRRYASTYKTPHGGWFPHYRGKHTYGLLSVCYRRAGGIKRVLVDPNIVKLREEPRGDYDWRIYMALGANKATIYGHYPSLTDHVGFSSTLKHRDGAYRRGWNYSKIPTRR